MCLLHPSASHIKEIPKSTTAGAVSRATVSSLRGRMRGEMLIGRTGPSLVTSLIVRLPHPRVIAPFIRPDKG
jgi:hypothetical protein